MAVVAFRGETYELRRHCDRRHEEMVQVRRPWLDYCKQVAQELICSRLPYLIDPNSGERAGEQNQHLVDSVGPRALTTAAAGIGTGTMPRSSQWLELVVRKQWEASDEERDYLAQGTRRVLTTHNQSNADSAFAPYRLELLAFGVGAALFFEDEEDVFRLQHLTVGEYLIAEDHRGRVDTLYRDFTATVGQLAQEFGKDRLGPTTRALYDRGQYDMQVPCRHCIEPDRWGYNTPELPWVSIYYELPSGCTEVLDVRGFTRFPALVTRWERLPGTPYAMSPGMEALPHLVRLRKMIYRYGQSMAAMAEPPLQYPAGLSQHEVRANPGGKTPVYGNQKVETLYQVQMRLAELGEEIQRTREDIRETLGATLVASLRSIDRQITAREADLRTSQDLAEWLPGLYRLTDEMLNPYVEMVWEALERIGELPDRPDSLDGKVVDIEFQSPLARKQRQGDVDAIQKTFAIAAGVAPVKPEILDNIDFDRAIRIVGEIEGAPPDFFVSLQAMKKERVAKQQAQAAQAQMGAAQQGADLYKTIGEGQAKAPAA